jgi:(E)-4-hydroxy-3-methylbut-2-enyl-diphosphate synthase
MTTIDRRKTREVSVGNVAIGGDNSIRIQSMTSVPTKNVTGNVEQICELVECGCEIVRLAVTTVDDVKSLAEIKNVLHRRGTTVPVVADVHFSPMIATNCLMTADKVRINAGNFSDKLFGAKEFSEDKFVAGKRRLQEKLEVFFAAAKAAGKPIRIGINSGSLAPRVTCKFGHGDEAMWESAKECLEAAEQVKFGDLVLSFKASDVGKMVSANRLACAQMDQYGWNFPIHLGVTESGNGDSGRIKSAIGIGTLLMAGIGDTIRVSLTENPVNEIGVAKDILQACGINRHCVEIISCPSCGRTTFDIQLVLDVVKSELGKLKNFERLKVAVMGCAINGLGEAGDADLAIVGNPNGSLSIYGGGKCIARGVAVKDLHRDFLKKIHKFQK